MNFTIFTGKIFLFSVMYIISQFIEAIIAHFRVSDCSKTAKA